MPSQLRDKEQFAKSFLRFKEGSLAVLATTSNHLPNQHSGFAVE